VHPFIDNRQKLRENPEFVPPSDHPLLEEPLRAPIQFHFGDNDPSIPPEAVAAHRERQPGAEVHVYKGAGHAFNRDTDPAHYDGAAARLAHQRTMDLFARALA